MLVSSVFLSSYCFKEQISMKKGFFYLRFIILRIKYVKKRYSKVAIATSNVFLFLISIGFVRIQMCELQSIWQFFLRLGGLYFQCKEEPKTLCYNLMLLDYDLSTKFQIQGVLCLCSVLRLWKNNCISRKLCKWKSNLVLNGQMRVPK